MRHKAFIHAAILIVAGALSGLQSAAAADCDALRAKARGDFDAKYRTAELRMIVRRVNAALTPVERAEFAELSARFNAIPHNTPEHQNDRFAMHARARDLVRAATARAGFRLRNELPSPYDAQIGEVRSEDGWVETIIEVRDLLAHSDPMPHVTLWMSRQDPAHNPGRLVTAGIMTDPKDDYASWRSATGPRTVGTIGQYLTTLLPAECS